MKTVVVSVACCVLLTPLALAKESKKKQIRAAAVTVEQGVTVSATIVSKTPEGGEAASYQPVRTLLIRPHGASDSIRYVVDGPGHVVNQKGETVRTAVKPGTHVRVYFASTNGVRSIDHVVVD